MGGGRATTEQVGSYATTSQGDAQMASKEQKLESLEWILPFRVPGGWKALQIFLYFRFMTSRTVREFLLS